MGYGTSVVTPSGTVGNAFTVPSEFQYIQYASWVSDQDEYQRNSDHAIVQLKNSATDVNAVFNSGSLQNHSSAYDDTTGKRTVSFAIRAKQVPAGQVSYCLDTFVAKDLGNGVVKDADGSEQSFLVTVSGPPTTGGGTGGGTGG